MTEPPPTTGYLAVPGFEKELEVELGETTSRHGRLFWAEGPARRLAWAANIWLGIRRIPFSSISAATRELRALGRWWTLQPGSHYRRSVLIAEGLPRLKDSPLGFPVAHPLKTLGAFTLIDRDTLLAAPATTRPFPGGEARFAEDRMNPPSRAYLKLWEALTLIGCHPSPGEHAVDLGASPGAWTWALAALGARVTSIDKAPLDDRVAKLPGVTFRKASVFGIDLGELVPIDWLLCDVVCYPPKMLRFVSMWLEAGVCSRFIVTVKFQGETDMQVVERFKEIPNSVLLHLSHNKHELTWIHLPPGECGRLRALLGEAEAESPPPHVPQET